MGEYLKKSTSRVDDDVGNDISVGSLDMLLTVPNQVSMCHHFNIIFCIRPRHHGARVVVLLFIQYFFNFFTMICLISHVRILIGLIEELLLHAAAMMTATGYL